MVKIQKFEDTWVPPLWMGRGWPLLTYVTVPNFGRICPSP